jgi:cell division protein FtsQ
VTTKQIIKKIIFVALTLTACSGLVILLVAAIGKRNHELCKDYVITINGAKKNLFINETDINKLLNSGLNGKIKNEPITGFNLRKLEQLLKGNAWVKNANLYFDNREVLHVSVEEKEPIARIFTTARRSYYIDSEGEKMPLSNMLSARVPVFTNFPDKRVLSVKDSVLLDHVKRTASFILDDSFWMAQTEQIDITEDRSFEMIPTIGNHIVKLGNGDDIEKKFHRLFIFYQQVLSKTSFDKYRTVDVQYAGQVIGSRTKMSKVDSMQLRKNIEKLLQEARKMQNDTIASIPVAEQENIPSIQKKTAQTQHDPYPLKTTTLTKPNIIANKTEENLVAGRHGKPKAVMPEKNN